MDNSKIKLSIIILTYNHAKYIHQTIEGVLMQKTRFKYEVLIGDDASQDETPIILKQYASDYPDIFRLFLRKQNLGATKNSYEMLKYAHGEYIANLDGDDFWTDKNKLQIQVDFLDNNPEFIGCCHDELMVDEDGNHTSLKRSFHISNKKIYTLKDFKGIVLPGGTSSLVKRNIFIEPKYDYSILYEAHPMISDLTSAMIFLAQGNFYRINRTMGCYRRILKEGGKNFNSMYIGNARHIYDDYIYTCKLSDYANNVLHVDAGLESRKKIIFANAVCSFIMKPCNTRYEVVKTILSETENPCLYLLYLPIAIFWKILMKFKLLWGH